LLFWHWICHWVFFTLFSSDIDFTIDFFPPFSRQTLNLLLHFFPHWHNCHWRNIRFVFDFLHWFGNAIMSNASLKHYLLLLVVEFTNAIRHTSIFVLVVGFTNDSRIAARKFWKTIPLFQFFCRAYKYISSLLYLSIFIFFYSHFPSQALFQIWRKDSVYFIEFLILNVTSITIVIMIFKKPNLKWKQHKVNFTKKLTSVNHIKIVDDVAAKRFGYCY